MSSINIMVTTSQNCGGCHKEPTSGHKWRMEESHYVNTHSERLEVFSLFRQLVCQNCYLHDEEIHTVLQQSWESLCQGCGSNSIQTYTTCQNKVEPHWACVGHSFCKAYYERCEGTCMISKGCTERVTRLLSKGLPQSMQLSNRCQVPVRAFSYQ